MEIRSITAPNPGPLTLDGTHSWLLGETGVIDPGPAIESHVEAILSAMPRLEIILITHRHADHAPAAVPLSRVTGAKVVAPPGVLDETVVSYRVAGGESMVIGGVMMDVIATPGHTREHVCFLTYAGDLFTGDTILGSGTTAIFPPDGDMSDYIRSLRRLRSLAPRRIFPAHGPIREDAVALIDEYLEHRLAREQQVLDALAAGAGTLEAIRGRVYPDLDPMLESTAELQITAHLIKLRDEGRLPPALAELV
jgi:glyoxylase-like metal-dependent hydrolase (beta-lactamase superfamily II)